MNSLVDELSNKKELGLALIIIAYKYPRSYAMLLETLISDIVLNQTIFYFNTYLYRIQKHGKVEGYDQLFRRVVEEINLRGISNSDLKIRVSKLYLPDQIKSEILLWIDHISEKRKAV